MSEPNAAIQYHHLVDADAVARWRTAFIGAYQTVFSQEPYLERFSPAEADGIYRKLTSTQDHVTVIATDGPRKLIGFGIGVSLQHKADVARELGGLVPIRHTFYLAELGVLPSYRNQGIGRRLVQERMQRIDGARYSHAVLRMSSLYAPSDSLYASLGFESMGVSMEVRMLRTNGKVTTDRRDFLCQVLSQVPKTAPLG